MKIYQLLLIPAIVVMTAFTQTGGDEYEITRSDDKPFAFNSIGSLIKNEGSTLIRESILFNDKTCPVKIYGHSTSFEWKDRGYRINGETKTSISQAITAIEVRTAMYDIFGRHMHNLSNTEVEDGEIGSMNLTGVWRASDSDPSKLLTTVTWVARVRLSDGKQWVFNEDNLLGALITLNLENKIENDE